MQKAYVEKKESCNAEMFTWTVSVATVYVGGLPSHAHTLWDSSTENDLRDCEERREVLKPGSKILQCGIVQTIKGIFRTASVIAELL